MSCSLHDVLHIVLNDRIRLRHIHDLICSFEDDFLQTMLLMEPCGEGNPEPLFLMPAGPLSQVRTVGNHEHLVFQIETCGRTVSGVGFNLARQYAEFPGNEAALIFKLKQRYVRGREHPQMQVIELLHESGQ